MYHYILSKTLSLYSDLHLSLLCSLLPQNHISNFKSLITLPTSTSSLLFGKIYILYNTSSWNYLPTIQKIHYIYIVAIVLKDVKLLFMELRFHHLILGDGLPVFLIFLVVCRGHKCILDSFTTVLWILTQTSTPVFSTGWWYKISTGFIYSYKSFQCMICRQNQTSCSLNSTFH